MSEVIIQSLPLGASDAKRLASRLGIAAAEIEIHRFPDGELAEIMHHEGRFLRVC